MLDLLKLNAKTPLTQFASRAVHFCRAVFLRASITSKHVENQYFCNYTEFIVLVLLKTRQQLELKGKQF